MFLLIWMMQNAQEGSIADMISEEEFEDDNFDVKKIKLGYL